MTAEFFTSVPFETEGCAATVEVEAGLVVLRFLLPSATMAVALTRREARGVGVGDDRRLPTDQTEGGHMTDRITLNREARDLLFNTIDEIIFGDMLDERGAMFERLNQHAAEVSVARQLVGERDSYELQVTRQEFASAIYAANSHIDEIWRADPNQFDERYAEAMYLEAVMVEALS